MLIFGIFILAFNGLMFYINFERGSYIFSTISILGIIASIYIIKSNLPKKDKE